MAKDSRPDIQVLEDRIVRLKSQLLLYKDMRLYRSTKQRLSAVGQELADCISIIQSITTIDVNKIQPISSSALDDDTCINNSEFEISEDSDLMDTFPVLPKHSNLSSYSAKTIVSMYGTRINEGFVRDGSGTGILQANQFWNLLYSWYTNRYIPERRNPKFHFKASRIHEWVDLLIIAAGKAIHDRIYADFIQQFSTWVRNLNTSKDDLYALPYSVMYVQPVEPECCTLEAILLEYVIKPNLYDSAFYPEQLHSIRDIVTNSGLFQLSDLKLDSIISSCSSTILCTSLFDITKYQEV